MEELINHLEEYITFLEEECAAPYGFLYAHGYYCPPEKVRLGEEMRAKIATIKSRLNKS